MRFFTFTGIVFLLLLCGSHLQAQQCLGSGFCSGGVQYPSGTFSSNTNSWTTVTTANFAGEYAVYNVSNGSTYQWSLCSADGGSVSYDAQLTLINNSTLANICYSNDQCASNTPKIQWTATFTGAVRVLINQFNCLTNSTFTTIVWRCSSCGSGSAPANDNCTGAPALTIYSGSTCGGATTGNVSGATQSISAELCDGFTGTANDDIWYKFTTGAGGGNHTITVVGSASFDAVVDLRSGACNGTTVTCADASGSGGTEIISATLTGSTTYYVRVYDYYSGTPATTTFTICLTTPASCTPYYSTGTTYGDFVNRVQLNTIDNTPAGTGSTIGSYYNDYYSTVSTSLQAGTSQTITITVGTYGAQTVAAWIDYNADGDFADAGEKLGEAANVAASAAAAINFTIPAATAAGDKRMRVRTVWSDVGINACTTYSYGEGEDYKVTITPACTTPGTPVSLNTSGIGVAGATLNWSAGTPAGSATVTYYWALGAASNVTYEANYIQRGTTTSLNSGALSGLSPGTTYYWTVKAVTSCDGTASSYPAAISFTTSCTTPSAPTALNTTGITTNAATFNWTASAAGSPTISYYWAVGVGAGVTYEAGYTDRGITSSTNSTSFALNPGTTYYWTVKAVTSCNSTASSYPSAISFITNNVPPPIVTWIGGTNSDWQTVDDNVIIPSGCTFYPDITTGGLTIGNITTTRRCKTLTINSGGKVTVNSAFYVYVDDLVDISGTFNHHSSNATPDDVFLIRSGGKVTVKSGGILNVGSSSITAGLPSGTINEFNDIYIGDGYLVIEPGAKAFIMDNLVVTGTAGTKGKVTMNGGELWIKYYGDGSTTSYGFDTYANSIITLNSGDIYLCGQDNEGAGSRMVDWNTTASYSITGGTIHMRNEQSSGIENNPGYCDFGGKTLYNLTINRSSATSLIADNNLFLNGDLTITAGTFNANGLNITSAGNWTNNSGSAAFTAGTGTVTLSGSSKSINGSAATSFNNVTFNSGSSYTLSSSDAVPQATFNGTFNLNSGATFTLAAGKVISLAGASNIINGTLTAMDVYDGIRDIGLNNGAGQWSGTGTLTADLQVSSGTATLMNNFTINGDFIMNTGTFEMTTHTLTLYGSWTNNGAFTHGSGTVVFTGSSKNITGSALDGASSWLNNVTIQSGASYTFNPTGASNWDIDGSFNNYGTLNISAGKYLDIYASTAGGESVLQNGTITAVSVNDGTRDIDLNSTVGLSGSGTTTADLRIFSGTTTLNSNFTLGGGFTINAGATFVFPASSNYIFSCESWKNSGTLTTNSNGTVKFIGSGSRTVDANCFYSGAAKATADFYNVLVDRSSDTISMMSTPMRVANDFTIENGIFSTGWKTNANGDDGHNRRLTVVKIATIKPGGQLFIGYQRTWCTGTISADEANTGCPLSGDSLNVPVFLGDVINYGTIQTYRPKSSGYSDFKLKGARVTGLGTTNEFGVDIQPEDGQTVTQVGPVDIQGDLIIQDPAANLWENTDPNNILTIRGHFYLFGSFTHNASVNVYGNMNSSTYATDNITINSSTFNFYQSGATRFIYLDKNPIAFGHVNVIAGANTRELRQHITVSGNLTITSGTFDMYAANNSTITLSGSTSSWTNNGTFTPRSGTVSFTGNSAQSMGGTASTTFNNLTIANTSSTGVTFNNSGTVTNTLTLTDGILYTTSVKLLTINDQGTVSPSGGVAGSYVNGPVKKVGRDGGLYNFLFPIGKNGIWGRLYMEHQSGTTATTDAFTAEYFDNGYGTYTVNSPLSHVSSLEYWNLTKNSGNADLNKRVRLYSEDYNRSQLAAYNNSDLTVAHWNSGTSKWEDIGYSPNSNNSGAGVPSGWISSANTSSFSPFTFGSRSAANPLPVELLTFDAKLNGDKVDLIWTTATEVNNDYFTVERSKNLDQFIEIARVKGAGNSNTTNNYQITDNSPLEGLSYYRLKQTDFDGAFTYSQIVPVTYSKVKIISDKPGLFSGVIVYPNPGAGLFNVNFENENTGIYRFTVFDITGRRVYFSQKSFEKGNNTLPLHLEELDNGTYILFIEAQDRKVSHKIVLQK